MTGISTLGQALDQIERIKVQQLQLADLQLQLSTGKITQSFKGLEDNTIISKRARADIKQLDIYLTNITRGETRVNQMLNALDQIKQQAQDVLNGLTGQPQEGDLDLSIIKNTATNSFDFVANLLNSRDGDTYLFAGSDSNTPPFNDTGSLDTFMRDLNRLWTSGLLPYTPPEDITDAYIDQFTGAPDVTIGYSGTLNDAGKVFIPVDEGVELDYTLLANNPALRDVVQAIGVIKNLPDVIDAPPPQGQIVSTNDLAAATAGVDLFTAGGYVDGNDNFTIRFDPEGPNDIGPITIDLTDVQLVNPTPPATSGAQALADYINGTVIPTLPPEIQNQASAFINSSGQLVINAETDIEITSGTMGTAGLSFIGIEAGVTAPTSDESKESFFRVFNELAVQLTNAIDAIEAEQFRLNNVQISMAQTRENHELEQNTLLNTIDNVESADLNEVALSITTLQIQLEASFRVTAAVSNLSLVNFI